MMWRGDGSWSGDWVLKEEEGGRGRGEERASLSQKRSSEGDGQLMPDEMAAAVGFLGAVDRDFCFGLGEGVDGSSLTISMVTSDGLQP